MKFYTWRIFLLLSLPFFLLDQITKRTILSVFAEGPSGETGKQIEVIPGFFNLVRVHNRGMAFGRLNDFAYANALFVTIATAATAVIVWLWRKDAFVGKLSKIAVALLVSGIFGNVFDRLTLGYVVDFLDFDLGFMRWPSFNVADSCICIAAGLFIWGSFREEPAKEGAKSEVAQG